jgi:bifunctional UDP-N-acetylglucosamine pyrophosphorylase/glucosamine-1-phosphate N-acetyltransferase
MMMKNRVVDTGRRKLGVILGDEVKTGINALLMPGVKVGQNTWIGPDFMVQRDIKADTIVMIDREPSERKKSSAN